MTEPSPVGSESPELVKRQTRIGLVLFAFYLAAYGGFMGLSAFRPDAMGEPVWRGLNLAVLYGLGLIFGAVALALVYMVLCHLAAGRSHEPGDRK